MAEKAISLNGLIDYNNNIKATYQTKTDSNLKTTDKTIAGAINENKDKIDILTTDLNGYSFVDAPTGGDKELYVQTLENPLPPVISSGDEGKVLTVKADGTGFEYKTPTSSGGSSIDDSNITTTTTYSSNKINTTYATKQELSDLVLGNESIILTKLGDGEIIEWGYDAPVINVTGISLNKTTADIIIGSTETLTATILPLDATNQSVTWTSSNNSVATVNAMGIVTGVSEGSATITATSFDGGYTATCTCTIQSITVTGVTLNKTTTSINIGSTETLTATISPSNATNKNVTWSSSNTSIVTVNNGVITGVSVGSATITVTTADGSYTATCGVTISAISVTGVTLDKTTTTVSVGGTDTLTATVAPSNATNKTVTWTSSDITIATVNNGVVTGVAEGNCTITCTTTDGSKIATCNLIVQSGTISVTGVSVSPTTVSLTSIGATQQLTATITPSNATNQAVTWTSSNTAVATVNSTGLVTAVASGSATITATTIDGSKTATCSIAVNVAQTNTNIKAWRIEQYLYLDSTTANEKGLFTVDSSATDTTHTYYRVTLSSIYKTAVTETDSPLLFNGAIPYAGYSSSSSAFTSGSTSPSTSFCYFIGNGACFIRCPLGTTIKDNIAVIPIKASGAITEYVATDALLDASGGLSSTGETTDTLFYKGFVNLPTGGFGITTITSGINSLCLSTPSSLTSTGASFNVNATIRLNYQIAKTSLTSNTVTEVKNYLKANRLIFWTVA